MDVIVDELPDCVKQKASKEKQLPSYKNEGELLPKVWVRNLPAGISTTGIINLFLTVGKPLCISLPPNKDTAIVEFALMNEAELAVRDLNNKPPYNLKVSIYIPKHLRLKKELDYVQGNQCHSADKLEKCWPEKSPEEEILKKCEAEEKENEIAKEKIKIENFTAQLGYDPSIRIRQRKLDFVSQFECISLGRGFLYMGDKDHFVGGLQNFVKTSDICKSKDQENHSCEYCKSFTTKMCVNCSAPYCSKVCLSKSVINHTGDCAILRNNMTESQFKDPNLEMDSFNLSSSEKIRELLEVPLRSGCIVVITTYLTMQTVFVRRIDDSWEDEFSRLCNDIASAALEEGKFEEMPPVGELVIAKYYEDFSFNRARVSSLNEDKATVFFVDFGNSQETNLEDLKPLPDHLRRVPAFAVKVHLSDVSGSSPDSVKYFNKLTADRIPLILRFKEGTGEVILTDNDSKENINEEVARHALPSWKKDPTIVSKLGEIYYLDSLKSQNLRVGGKVNLKMTHFDENEFADMEVFWVTVLDTDEYFHANSEMRLKIMEYCEFLKDGFYLPRENELCLAREGGEWHRCVNLKSHRGTCCVFFVDDGHSSLVDRRNIRKIIPDFLETPAQTICCTLPENSKLKTDKEYQLKVTEYMKGLIGERLNDVPVLKLMGDAYCLSLPGFPEGNENFPK